MIEIRKSEERGKANIGWLNSKHTFSFGQYFDVNHMGFGPLRVINEDHVEAGAGFGTHPHDNMEIVSYVLDGALEHQDSMGNGSTIKPGDIQRMSAGSGITHSEYNHSKDENVHFLQIWFVPEAENIEPSYEQKSFSEAEKKGKLKLVMSRDAREDSVKINQDIDMYVGVLNGSDEAILETKEDRIQWVQVARGSVNLNGHDLSQGDGAAIMKEDAIKLTGANDAEIIVFDMAG